ncbi:MAG: Integrase catalytic region [Chitinophagaceae bacterium]|nr:Integrase catalytic region [Chitinophagaceae bacterium]
MLEVSRSNGLKAIQPRSFVPKTTDSRHPYRISPNLLKQRPAPAAANQVWVGDITYIPMVGGSFQYLSVWMDLFSRKIVGWDLKDHMRESLVTSSLKKAINSRKIKPGLLIHSDRGGQYAGTVFRQILDGPDKMLQSMSDADNPYDNAHMESFFSRFKAELMEGAPSRMLKIPGVKFLSLLKCITTPAGCIPQLLHRLFFYSGH